MPRLTMSDLARAADVSLSTVDRVLNGRHPVRRDKAERVMAAAAEIGFRATGLLRQRLGVERPERAFAFILQQPSDHFYRVLSQALAQATRADPAIRGEARVDFVDAVAATATADLLVKVARTVDAVAVVAADHPRLTEAIAAVRERGVPVIALISDLSATKRAGYVGLDSRKVGRTAAWAMANLCRAPGKIGISLGSHRFLSQEGSEVSFRAFIGAHAPGLEVLETTTSFEEPRFAYENARHILQRHPDLTGLYVAGGGLEGIMAAIRDEGAERRLVTVGRELTLETRAGLADGTLNLVISHPLKAMAEAVVRALTRASLPGSVDQCEEVILPIEVHTPESV